MWPGNECHQCNKQLRDTLGLQSPPEVYAQFRHQHYNSGGYADQIRSVAQHKKHGIFKKPLKNKIHSSYELNRSKRERGRKASKLIENGIANYPTTHLG